MIWSAWSTWRDIGYPYPYSPPKPRGGIGEIQARYTGETGVHDPRDHLAHEIGDALLVHLPHVTVPVRVGHLVRVRVRVWVRVRVRVRARARARARAMVRARARVGVGHLEVLELVLQVLELLGDPLVLLGEVLVLLLVPG